MKEKKDVIIVMGGNVTKKGNVPQVATERVKLAAELFKKGLAKKIIVSGKWSLSEKKPQVTTEAESMKKLLIKLGIPKKVIIKEDRAMDSIGNAYFSKKIIDKHNFKKIIVVPSDFSAKRVKWIFNKFYGKKYKIKIQASDGLERGRELKRKLKHDDEILQMTKEWMKNVNSQKELDSFFRKEHPAYSSHAKKKIDEIILRYVKKDNK
jgi:uncharacterized SAM-binding protein YcdF (DUF218 family)